MQMRIQFRISEANRLTINLSLEEGEENDLILPISTKYAPTRKANFFSQPQKVLNHALDFLESETWSLG
jgi:hypothetical protein